MVGFLDEKPVDDMDSTMMKYAQLTTIEKPQMCVDTLKRENQSDRPRRIRAIGLARGS